MTVLRTWAATPRRGLVFASVAGGAGTVLAGVGLMAVSGYLIARTAEQPPILDLMVVFVAVRFFGLARPALRYFERLASHDVTFRLLLRVRRWFIEALLPLAPARLIDYRSGDLLARLAGDVERLRDIHLRVVAPALVAVVVGASVTAGAAQVDLRLAVIVLGLLAIEAIVWPMLARGWTRGLAARGARERRALSARLVPLLQGIGDVLAFGRERHELTALEWHQQQIDAVRRRDAAVSATHASAAAFAAHMGLWTALWLLIPMVAEGRLSGPWAAAVMLGIVAAFEAVDGVPSAWLAYEHLQEAVDRVGEVLSAPPAVTGSGGSRVPLSEIPVEPLTGEPSIIRFTGVRLAHRGSDTLRDVSFQVSPGEHIAIVGPSGAGKSTVLSMIARVWDPTWGTVALRGLDARQVPLADLRASLAIMPQQVHVFDDTLRENVRVVRPSASEAQILDALRHAQLEQLLGALPEGLDTRLGEHGSRLSAGERQRLGLARLMLSDAPLVLVDEPTANLDAVTERDVLHQLRTWSRGRTLLLVTHRLVALESMDRVIVMNAGTVVESGTYQQLLCRRGSLWTVVHAERERLAA